MTAPIEIGTISHGTLRSVDLLQAFASELNRIGADSTQAVVEEAFTRVAQILRDGDEENETDSELVMALQECLEALAPAGCYFGTLEGDGSDFGFWPIDEEF